VVAQARKERHVIPAQNRAMSFELDPAKDGAYTTDECYGCTPVFMVSGKVLCGSHFVEIGTGDKNNWDKDAGELFMENVLVPLEEEILEENKEKLGEEPLAVVFTPSTSDQDKLIYKNRIDGVGECEEETVVQVIKDAFPKARIHVVSYFREQAKFSGSHEDAPWGKIAFEWKSSASGGDGNNVLNVFAEDRWIVQAKFNADGGLISAENTPPGTPPLSGGSGAGSPPPVTPPL
jgi:hypothetical protein